MIIMKMASWRRLIWRHEKVETQVIGESATGL
jgi:hypothetical protein